MYRTYILRLMPNKTQTKLLDKTISCVQKFDDIYLNQIKDKYTCSGFEIIKEARNIDSNLISVDNTILFCELDIIQKIKKEKKLANRFEFKTNYCKYVESIEDVISNHTLYLPSIGHIKLFNKRDYDQVEKFISITVYRTIDEKYFANVLFRKKNRTVDKSLDLNNSIGLDYSSNKFYVDNNGESPKKPTLIRDYDKEILAMQKKFAELRNDNKPRQKLLTRYCKTQRHVANKRNDFLHKTSRELADKYDYVFAEDINFSEIVTYRKLGKATNDNAYHNFLEILNYKMEDRGKKLVKIDKNYPSSRKCSNCGYVREKLALDERSWICPECGVVLDRDINAAINIRNRGIEIASQQAAGRAARSYA